MVYKKNLIVFGTRPEALKMIPLIKKFKGKKGFEAKVCEKISFPL